MYTLNKMIINHQIMYCVNEQKSNHTKFRTSITIENKKIHLF